MMTMPGSPAVQYDDAIGQKQVQYVVGMFIIDFRSRCYQLKYSCQQNESLKVGSSHGDEEPPSRQKVGPRCLSCLLSQKYTAQKTKSQCLTF